MRLNITEDDHDELLDQAVNGRAQEIKVSREKLFNLLNSFDTMTGGFPSQTLQWADGKDVL